MILYDYWRSSSAWRVRIGLHYKQIAFERRVVNLAKEGGGEQHAPEFQAVNPMRQVPVLEVEEGGARRTLAQSLAILTYLEARFPSPPLLPADPWPRARALQLAEMVNAGIQPMQNLALHQHLRSQGIADPPAFSRHFIARGLEALEAAARETAGTFLIGDAPTIADVYLVPQLYGARRFGAPVEGFPTLLRAEAACGALPAFAAAHPDVQTDAVPAPKA
ncbi:MAG TPA: maleylacetoacetate isomerase [Polyangia bacterium]|nr:maleylacetoacetate isomerase [Polyangia bacterium]